MLNKGDVLRACIVMWEQKLARTRGHFEGAKDSAVNAVGSMVSWSDTTKFQQSQIADGLNVNVKEAELILNQLQRITPVNVEVVGLGAVFTLHSLDAGEINSYLVVNAGGGNSFQLGEVEITLISLNAPLLKAVLGKRVGDHVIFREKAFEITEVH